MYRHASRRAFSRYWLSGLTALLPSSLIASEDSEEAAAKADDKNDSHSPPAAADAPEAVYEPGGDVKPPKLVHYVEPDFSPESKEAYVEGVVRISTVVKTDGKPAQLHVVKGLNAEEDRQATIAVNQWRFQPGTRQGQPVNVRVLVEVDFHLL